jgi:hypothetical protein
MDVVGEIGSPHPRGQTVADHVAEPEPRRVRRARHLRTVRPTHTHRFRHHGEADEVHRLGGRDVGLTKLADDVAQLVQRHTGVRGAGDRHRQLHEDDDLTAGLTRGRWRLRVHRTWEGHAADCDQHDDRAKGSHDLVLLLGD